MTPRVVVADATAFVRLAVRAALEEDGIEVAAEVATAAEVAEAVGREPVDVVLVDAELDPDLETIGLLREAHPTLGVLVLVPDTSTTQAWAALRAGACGVVPKDAATDRLAAVVRGVAAGEAALPRGMVRELLDTLYSETRRRTRGAGEGLSPREQEVMDLLAHGHDDQAVGRRLGISVTTVRRHVGTAAHKLGTSRRAEAIERYRRVTDGATLAA